MCPVDSTGNMVGLSERIKSLFETVPVEGAVPIKEEQRKEQCINFLVQLYPASSFLVSQFISVCRAVNSYKFWSVQPLSQFRHKSIVFPNMVLAPSVPGPTIFFSHEGPAK